MTRPGGIVRLALWLGLLAGWAEAAIYASRKYLFGEFLRTTREVWWLVIAADTLLLAAWGLFVAGLALAFRDRLGARAVTFLLVFPAALTVVWAVPRFHRAAAALLALGIALQGARLAAARWDGFGRAVRRSLVPLAAGALLLAGVLRGWPSWREWRGGAGLPEAAAGAPNVLLIILDTARALSFSLYGAPRETSPALVRWSARGTTFDNALAAAPWTLPSHASLFTGRWPHELSAGWFSPLDGRAPVLAEALAARGYATAGFVANAAYAGWESGLGRGFARYDDFPLDRRIFLTSSALWRSLLEFRPVARTLRVGTPQQSRLDAAEMSAALLGWLDRRDARRPFFAFVNYFDAHTPYVPPEPWASRFRTPGDRREIHMNRVNRPGWTFPPEMVRAGLASYEGAIAYLDAELDRLFSALERRGVLAQTLVIVTSDHGEEFNEHGVVQHGNSLYRAGVHVPLLVWLPGAVPAGMKVPAPVSLRDLPATVMALTGGDPSAFPGTTLGRFWTDAGGTPADTVRSELAYAPRLPSWYPVSKGDMASVVHDGWRYIRNGDGREELYDFHGDPGETRDRARDPALRARLEGLRSLAEPR